MSLLSPDGVKPINTITELITQEYQHQQCGSNFGVESTGAIAASLISKLKKTKILHKPWFKTKWTACYFISILARQQPFVLGVYTVAPGTAVSPAATTGFNLDYTQV